MSKNNLKKDALKICIIGSSKYFFSGLSAHTIFLSNALSKDNEISVILLRKLLPEFLYPGKKHLNKNNYLINIEDGLDIYEKMDWNSPLSWIRASNFLRQHKPDAIIMLWWTSSVAHMQLLLALTNKLSVRAELILEMHEIVDPLEEKILPIRIYSRLAGRLLLRNADAFAVHSSSAKQQVSKIYKIKENKIFLTPIGLYDDYKLDFDKNIVKNEFGVREKFVLLNFGSVRKYKGVSSLVKAYSGLPEYVASNSRLIIAGEDWGDDIELGPLIEASPYRFNITFISHFIDDKDIPRYFSMADVIVLPYLRSCGSGVAHIAMVYRKPIITSKIDTMIECLQDYPGAYFAPPSDISAIQEKIIELYQMQQEGKNIVINAPENNWDKVAKTFEEIIHQVGDNP